MKIAAIDDEALGLSRLERLLSASGKHKISTFSESLVLLDTLKTEKFDALFLDINMPQMDGVTLAREAKAISDDIFIVFVTAHDNYTLDAFDIGAVDYLLKPFEQSEIDRAISRIENYKKSQKSTKLIVKNGDESALVAPEDIIYVQADLAEVIIRTKEALYYYGATMTKMQEILEPHEFFRVHRTYLINTAKIKQMTQLDQSRIRFTFHGIGETIDSSKDGAKHFRMRFSDKADSNLSKFF